MELINIAKEIYECSKSLGEAKKYLKKLAEDKDNTEKEYRQALALEILRLREDKIPATLISDIAKGNQADLKFKRDLAEDIWTGALKSLSALESRLCGLQSILKYQDEV